MGLLELLLSGTLAGGFTKSERLKMLNYLRIDSVPAQGEASEPPLAGSLQLLPLRQHEQLRLWKSQPSF